MYPSEYKGQASKFILFLMILLLALLILAVVSYISETFFRNSSLDLDCIASLGKLTVTTPSEPILVDPAPKLQFASNSFIGLDYIIYIVVFSGRQI